MVFIIHSDVDALRRFLFNLFHCFVAGFGVAPAADGLLFRGDPLAFGLAFALPFFFALPCFLGFSVGPGEVEVGVVAVGASVPAGLQ